MDKKPEGPSKQQIFIMNVVVYMFVGIVILFIFSTSDGKKEVVVNDTSYTDFTVAVDGKRIQEVAIKGDTLNWIIYGDNNVIFKTVIPDGMMKENIITMINNGVQINTQSTQAKEGLLLMNIFISWFPMLLFVGVWVFFMKSMQGGGKGAMGFGKSKAKMIKSDEKKVTFQDVAGIDEAKEELQEIIEFLKEPQKFQKLGGKIPQGVLLMGAPGTGKTLLARAVAGEADVPFFAISGSDFVEMFVGVGASRVRDLFEQGKKNAPCIIFIDEIDAVGRHRGAGIGGGHDEREQTLNQLLVQMDGFEKNSGVIMIAATNRPDVLDPALMRPGRFDRQVTVPKPDVKGREGILKVHAKDVPMGEDVDLSILARGTPGMSGADLANMINEGALLAARKGHEMVTMQDLEDGKDKSLAGAERKSLVISDKEKRDTSKHEVGHTIVTLFTLLQEFHKVSIIPRGRAMGLTMFLPSEMHTHPKSYLLKKIMGLMGGRAAEMLFIGENAGSDGCSNDIGRATDIATKMVCEFGMSKELGPIKYSKKSGDPFLGRDITKSESHGDQISNLIDTEIKRIVIEEYDKATELLKKHKVLAEALIEELFEKETLSRNEVIEISKKVGDEIKIEERK